jgi:hypothetical protein
MNCRHLLVLGGAVSLLTAACATTQPETRRAEGVGAGGAAAVECLLPSQIRKLGSQFVYLAPRRTVITSPHDCEVRGGTVTSPPA